MVFMVVFDADHRVGSEVKGVAFAERYSPKLISADCLVCGRSICLG